MLSDKYRINIADSEGIDPEETLVDSLSEFSSVEVPISQNVYRAVYFFVGAIFLLFIFRSIQLQIIDGKNYFAIAEKVKFYKYSAPSLRGIIYDRNGKALVENLPVFDIVAVNSQLSNKENEYKLIDNALNEKDGFTRGIIEKNKNNGVFVVKKSLPKEMAILLHTYKIPGIYVVPYAKRNYMYDEKTAHLLGYTSQMTTEELLKNPDIGPEERVGRVGLESEYDSVLRGEPFDVVLDPSIIKTQSPKSGENIYTNIDLESQLKLSEVMKSVFASYGVQRGAAVVQNVNTGEVLALYSLPTFDPNSFENSGDKSNFDYIQKVFSDTRHPLFDRAVSGLYSPGSTIKPYLALIGLTEGNVNTSTTIYSAGQIEVQSEVNPSEYYIFRDWKVHGWTDIYKAISDSVDVYFYALGGGYQNISGLGVDILEKYLKLGLIDKRTGIDLPAESFGLMPSKKWKKDTKGEPWYIGDTYNISIGQGDMLVTPIWLNTYVSAIANGGNMMKPKIVKGEPEILTKLPFDQNVMNIVRKGMRRTVTDGTGISLKDLPVEVAAKTGTAQVSSGMNSLFIVYGPFDNPDIAMTVLVENITESQSIAMRVAKNYLSWYFSKQ